MGGIIAGSLAYLLAYQIVGASLLLPLSLQGASAALLSALVAGIVYDRRVLSSFVLRFFGQRLSPLLLGVLLLLIFLSASRGNAGGHVAHLGGLLFGLAYGYYCRGQKGRPDADGKQRLQLLERARHSGFASLSPAERRSLMKYTHVPRSKNEHPHD